MICIRNPLLRSSLSVFLLALFALPASAITPDDPGPADVLLTINSGGGHRAISPYIYGSNSALITSRTSERAGGNRWTGYNWETNASNAGSDWYHHSDYHLTNGQANRPPGAAVSGMLQSGYLNDRASIVTVPMAGYVSADANGTVDETEIAPSSRWREVVPTKSTIYPGQALSTNPNKTDGYVFTDEFVNWVENTRQNDQPVFYSLDNEPALWGEPLPPGWQSGIQFVQDPSPGGRTHPTIHPFAPTYTEMRDKTIAHASAIKDVNPDALVFGGVGYGWLEAVNLQNAPGAVQTPSHPGGDQNGELHYYEWLLSEVAAAEATQGRTLMDVIDLHWYPEAQGRDSNGNLQRIVFSGGSTDPGVVEARVQAPRSLWDPTYRETSWITGCCSGGPIKLLPHLQRDIDDFKPDTKIAITEYNYGAGDHISGGVAQADFLGILGREGVFAANWWDLGQGASFVSGAFDMFLNFDGAGGTFGDLSIAAATDDIDASAVYASVDSDDPSRLVLVAINRTDQPLDTALALTSDFLFDRAEVYQLTTGSSTPQRTSDIELTQLNAFHYEMPAFSVSTLVLQGTPALADLDADGDVDGHDLLLIQKTDPSLLATWQEDYGKAGTPAASLHAVPEPTSFGLLLLALTTLAFVRKMEAF